MTTNKSDENIPTKKEKRRGNWRSPTPEEMAKSNEAIVKKNARVKIRKKEMGRELIKVMVDFQISNEELAEYSEHISPTNVSGLRNGEGSLGTFLDVCDAMPSDMLRAFLEQTFFKRPRQR